MAAKGYRVLGTATSGQATRALRAGLALEPLRTGDPAQAVAWYADHGRITVSPTRRDTIAAAVQAWAADRDQGRETILLAWRRADVAALNRAARQHLKATGELTGPEVEAPGGRRYAVGDQVVTLSPDPQRRWVTSQRGSITALDDDRVTVRLDDRRSVTLAGDDLDHEHLDHAYALTVHRTQGATVDTAHVLADGGGRELAYVAMSRARHTTHIHSTADDLDQAVDDLTHEWTSERRDRWLHDTNTPATPGAPIRPALHRRPDADIRDHQTRDETAELTNTLERPADVQQKINAITRRLDALQQRADPPSRGIGTGIG